MLSALEQADNRIRERRMTRQEITLLVIERETIQNHTAVETSGSLTVSTEILGNPVMMLGFPLM